MSWLQSLESNYMARKVSLIAGQARTEKIHSHFPYFFSTAHIS
jgi:hypothetical protein